MSASFGSGLGYTLGPLFVDWKRVCRREAHALGWLDGSIYLVHRAQVADANTGCACDPVLASVPAVEDGLLVYDVLADLTLEWTESPAPPVDPEPTPPPESPFAS